MQLIYIPIVLINLHILYNLLPLIQGFFCPLDDFLMNLPCEDFSCVLAITFFSL